MLRIIFISIVTLALSACDKAETNNLPTESSPVQKAKEHGHIDKKDMEHHINSTTDGHEPHPEHGDKEHHSSDKKDGHDHAAEHQDTEHHGSEKVAAHKDNHGHTDKEHHEQKQTSLHEHADGHDDTEHHGEKKAAHKDHDGHKDEEHHSSQKDRDDDGHGHGGNDEHGEEGVVRLTPEQIKASNIVIQALSVTDVATRIRAPGEIKLNAYRTIKVSPRINAQVTARHTKLGDKVSLGQALVTLSSVEMAEAQGQLLLADKEWKRVKKLGRKVVSERRYITAKVDYDKAFANVKAFGMNEEEIKALLSQKRSADGSFKLVAQQAGRVLHDKFIIGERVEAGYELMVISDESLMWVEARVTPDIAGLIDIGNAAEIVIDEQRIPAKVVQLHHTLDEVTRTSAVRIEVENKEDHLHAGMFVTTFIATHIKKQGMQLPEAAVLRSADGDWQVMVEQDKSGEFKAQEVKLKSVSDGKAVISGIKPGTRVVTHGAFFVQSELMKSGFDAHNH